MHGNFRSILLPLLLAGATLPFGASQAAELLASPSYSISASFNSLSNSSGMATEGDYQIVQMAPAADHPGFVQLTLQHTTQPALAAVELLVPAEHVAQAALQQKQIVTASKRPYGMEFATQEHQAFAIVLNEAWQNDLVAHQVL
jgi:hypothetical protein